MFTLDEAYVRAVTEAFVRMYEKGLIYRRKRLVNWYVALVFFRYNVGEKLFTSGCCDFAQLKYLSSG